MLPSLLNSTEVTGSECAGMLCTCRLEAEVDCNSPVVVISIQSGSQGKNGRHAHPDACACLDLPDFQCLVMAATHLHQPMDVSLAWENRASEPEVQVSHLRALTSMLP